MPFKKGEKPNRSPNKGGRPRASHTLASEKARQTLIKEVTKIWKPLIRAQIDLALGHWKEEVKEGGKVKVYMTSPDKDAIKYLVDQTIGRPKESMEVSGTIKTLIVDF